MKLKLVAAFLFSLLMALTAVAAPNGSLPPKDAKCPVCGMFVAKYPDWVVSVTFRDATSVFFDGAKDMFTYYLNLKKYTPSRSIGDVTAVTVRDYYDLKPMDGRKAFFIVGSDVYGPMGKELIPFRTEADAREFLKDHKGKYIVSFAKVTPTLLKTLE